MSIRAEIRQRPVGQGGLCEGWIGQSRATFRWVYDCGSNQTSALTREINRVGGPIGLLFLSHLDNDHVNGVDALLAARQTDEVVLPYLNDDERIVLMAAAASSGAFSGSFLTFARDPAAWLLDRGVERVTYIRGGDDGTEPDADAPDPDKLPPSVTIRLDERGPVVAGWDGEAQAISPDGRIRELQAGTAFDLLGPAEVAIWTLLPQAHRPSPQLLAAFRAELTSVFGSLTPDEMAQAARRETGRTQLVACYEKIWSDHNLISLSLYAGPHRADERPWTMEIRHPTHRRYGLDFRPDPTGWISTGDAKLSVKARRRAFHRTFARYLASTAVLVTPHHGAATSWADDVLDGFDRLKVGCAAYGKNSYDHPNTKVVEAIENLPGAMFVRVTEHDRHDLVLKLRRSTP
jgi:hypothetical protein